MQEELTESISGVAAELRVVLGQLARRLREQPDSNDLTRSQTSVLSRLERGGPLTATVLARAEGVRPQSMSTIVAALAAAGLIVGSPDGRDGRKTLLSLTDKAREEFQAGRLAREDWLAQAMTATLDASEVEQLRCSVDLLRRLAGS